MAERIRDRFPILRFFFPGSLGNRRVAGRCAVLIAITMIMSVVVVGCVRPDKEATDGRATPTGQVAMEQQHSSQGEAVDTVDMVASEQGIHQEGDMGHEEQGGHQVKEADAQGSNEGHGSGAAIEGALEVHITAKEFTYEPNELLLKVGVPVNIIFTNAGLIEHQLILEAFDFHAHIRQTGGSHKVGFIPDRTGTFTYYCAIPGHKEAGMVGTLVVTAE